MKILGVVNVKGSSLHQDGVDINLDIPWVNTDAELSGFTGGTGGASGTADRGVVFGGEDNTYYFETIEYFGINTFEKSSLFGNLTTRQLKGGGTSNGYNDRGITAFFYDGTNSVIADFMNYITISTLGDATSFGNISRIINQCEMTSNATNNRGIRCGGFTSTYHNWIDYVQIDSLGDATEFGEINYYRMNIAHVSNGTQNRCVIGGGWVGGYTDIMEYVNISSPSNAIDFGDMVIVSRWRIGASNDSGNRGIFVGHWLNGKSIDYFNISTLGDALDYGDLKIGAVQGSGISNGVGNRGVFAGYTYDASFGYKIPQTIKINILSNASYFGEMTRGAFSTMGCSNSFSNPSPPDPLPDQYDGKLVHSRESDVLHMYYKNYHTGGDRGVFLGGNGPHVTIDYVTISTICNAIDFGDLYQAVRYTSATSNISGNRGVVCGAYSAINIIQYITISSPSNSEDFGDLIQAVHGGASCSSGINNRGLKIYGYSGGTGYVNTIEYITISTLGNANNFGDMGITAAYAASTSNYSGNRGIVAGGNASEYINTIYWITIQTTSNGRSFGDLINGGRSLFDACSNDSGNIATFGGGYDSSNFNYIEHVTITIPSDASDFGELEIHRRGSASCSNLTGDRGLFASHTTSGRYILNTIEQINISTPSSKAAPFGNLTVSRYDFGAISNGVELTQTVWESLNEGEFIKRVSNHTVKSTDVGYKFHNLGATQNVTFQLPSAEQGSYFTFIDCEDIPKIIIQANTGDSIDGNFEGNLQSGRGSASITIFAIDNSNWVIMTKYGSWTQEVI